jgi:hypothetical protein
VALRELQEHLISLYGARPRVVILIDEAHVMPDDTLEQVRLLSNLESNRHKLLQIVLFGQPELDATLAKTSLRQLRDRITHSSACGRWCRPKVGRYLSFRMRAAGYRGPEVFTPHAVRRIARASGGLTRRINIVADKSLLSAYTENTHAITHKHVRAAVADSEFAAPRRSSRPLAYIAAAAAAGIAAGAAMHWMLAPPEVKAPPAPAPAAPSAAAQPAAPAAAAGLAGAGTGQGRPPIRPSRARAAPHAAQQLRRLSAYRPAAEACSPSAFGDARAPGAADDERYALELYVTENSDPARMERFLSRARDLVPLEQST